MAGNKVFRATETFFAGRVKVVKGALVREGHEVLAEAEHFFEELKVDFERDDIKAKRDADAAAAAAAKAEADAKAAAESAATKVEEEAPKVEGDVEKDATTVASDVKAS
jgi:hypothetical protein